MSAAPHYPENPRSPHADDLHSRLQYQARLNTLLVGRVRPEGRRAVLSASEMHEAETAYMTGVSADTFAAKLTARDQRAASEPPVRTLFLIGGRR